MRQKLFMILSMGVAFGNGPLYGACTKVHIYYKEGTNWTASGSYTPCGEKKEKTYSASNWWDNFFKIESNTEFKIGPKITGKPYYEGLLSGDEVGIQCSGQLGINSTCDVHAPYFPSPPKKEGCIAVHVYYSEDANWGGSAYYTPCGATKEKREVVNNTWDNYLSVQPDTAFSIGPMGTSTNYLPAGTKLSGSKPKVGIKCTGKLGISSTCDATAPYEPPPPLNKNKKQPTAK